jgi:hypothetical protein
MAAPGQFELISTLRRHIGFGSIVLKNSENEQSRKTRFRAPDVTHAGSRRDKEHARATRGETGRSAEPLPNFPSRPPWAF